MEKLKNEIEQEIKLELENRKERMKRTLELWKKLQEKMDQILTAEKLPSASMLSTISSTLNNQLKLDRQGLEELLNTVAELNEVASKECCDDDEVETQRVVAEVQLPFPVNTDGSITSYQNSDVAAENERNTKPVREDMLQPIELP